MRRALALTVGLVILSGAVWSVAAGPPRGRAPADEPPDSPWPRRLEVPGADVFDVAIAPSQPSTVYAATSRGVYRSLDDGRSWAHVLVAVGTAAEETGEEAAAQRAGSVTMLPDRPGVVVAALGARLWRSDDDGRTWRLLPPVGVGAPVIRSLRVIPGDRDALYAATDAGLFRVPLPPAPGPDPPGVSPPPPGAPLADGRFGGVDAREPGVREVQAAAIRYAEVMPEKIQGWRTLAAWRAWVPRFTLSLDRDSDTTIGSSSSGGKTSFTVGPDDRSVSVGYGFTWDLADLVWNPDQTSIDIRSRLMVQLRGEILDDVTRLYFERRRLQAEYAALPVREATLAAERRLRIEELTAQLDGLTGGYFSEAMQ